MKPREKLVCDVITAQATAHPHKKRWQLRNSSELPGIVEQPDIYILDSGMWPVRNWGKGKHPLMKRIFREDNTARLFRSFSLLRE